MATKESKLPTVNIKGKPYVLVKDRIEYLREEYAGRFEIRSNYEYVSDLKMFIVTATLTLWNEDHTVSNSYVGTSQEIVGGNGVNATSALENAETSAVGRACGFAGIGVVESIASADEVTKAVNTIKLRDVIGDKPVDFTAVNADVNKTQEALDDIRKMLDQVVGLKSEDDRFEQLAAITTRIEMAEKQGLLKVPRFAKQLEELRMRAENYISPDK